MMNLLETMFTFHRFDDLKLKLHLENRSIHLVEVTKTGLPCLMKLLVLCIEISCFRA